MNGAEGRIRIDPLEFHVGAIAIEGADESEQHAVTPLEGPYFDLSMTDRRVMRRPGSRCRLSRMRRGAGA